MSDFPAMSDYEPALSHEERRLIAFHSLVLIEITKRRKALR